jgi:nucleoside-triphosphatase THEP1
MRSGKWNAYPQSSEKTIQQILDSDRPFIATIAKSGPPFIDRIRCRRDMLPVEITRENRDSIHCDIVALAGNLLAPPS